MVRGDFVYLNCKGHCGAGNAKIGVHLVDSDTQRQHLYSTGSEGNTTTLRGAGDEYNFWHLDECLSLFVKEVL